MCDPRLLLIVGVRGPSAVRPLAEEHGTRCVFGECGPGTEVHGTDASDSTILTARCRLVFADDHLAHHNPTLSAMSIERVENA